jgi:hypothetical protein
VGKTILLLALAVAAPPPKESAADVFRRVWGETLDPEKDCKVDTDGSHLVIRIPGTPHQFTPLAETTNSKAPRVRREVVGDFDARVKVVSVTPPGENAEGVLMTSGGIFMGTDDNTFITISRYTTRGRNGPGLSPQFLSQQRTADTATSELKDQPAEAVGKPVFVRLVREGRKVTTFTGLDGETWTVHVTRTFDWPEKVFLGVFTSHAVNHAVEGVFEDFRIAKPGK